MDACVDGWIDRQTDKQTVAVSWMLCAQKGAGCCLHFSTFCVPIPVIASRALCPWSCSLLSSSSFYLPLNNQQLQYPY